MKADIDSTLGSEMQKTTPRGLQEVVETFKKSLGESLMGIALFGSTARGEAHGDSDWDIFILTKSLPYHPFERQMFLRALLPKWAGTKVSLMAKTDQEFEHRLLSVYLDMATDGVILFDPQGYLESKFEQIKETIEKEELVRKRVHRTWAWVWKKSRGRDWELDWP